MKERMEERTNIEAEDKHQTIAISEAADRYVVLQRPVWCVEKGKVNRVKVARPDSFTSVYPTCTRSYATRPRSFALYYAAFALFRFHFSRTLVSD